VREKQANRRIRLLLAVFVLVFAGTLARAVWLQGVRAAELGGMAERQHHESITIPAGRGTIFDDKGVQLAIGEQTMTVYADPRQVRNARAVAVAAHRLLGVDANTLYPQLLNKKSSFLYVKRFADPKAAGELIKKGLAGVNAYPEEKRAYPLGSVAAQLVVVLANPVPVKRKSGLAPPLPSVSCSSRPYATSRGGAYGRFIWGSPLPE